MSARLVLSDPPIRPTRFPALGYMLSGPNLWRIVDTDSGMAVGPFYRTKAELLADLDRYAREYGASE